MRVQGVALGDVMETAMAGMKGVLPAIVILALAYALNQLSRDLGTARYILELTEARAGAAAGADLPHRRDHRLLHGDELGHLRHRDADRRAPGARLLRRANSTRRSTRRSPPSRAAASSATTARSGHLDPRLHRRRVDHIDHVRTQLPYALIVGALAIVYIGIGAVANSRRADRPASRNIEQGQPLRAAGVPTLVVRPHEPGDR